MKYLIFIFISIQSISAQKPSLSLRASYEWIQPNFVQEELISMTSNIGYHYPTEGYRIGLTYHQPVYKSMGILTEGGYSQGGFDGFRHDYTKKLNQIFLIISPQYFINKYFSITAGGILNYTLSKKTSQGKPDPAFISKNYGSVLGGSLHLYKFELGFRYIHYLNPYYDYSKDTFFQEKSYQYWDIKSVFLGFHFWKKD